MPSFRAGEFSQWASTMWENRVPSDLITGVSVDTRTLKPGNLYIALRGERFDGHNFLTEAIEQGAAGVMIEKDYTWNDGPVLRVEDTLLGLQALAAGYRNTWQSKVIGITGSVGKTTTKEMCADILSAGYKVHRTQGNFNNHIGLPLSMMRQDENTEVGVYELGMNHPGEIAPLAALLRPQIAVITEISNAHIEHFDSIKEIAIEKANLLKAIPSIGTVVLDCTSEWFSIMGSYSSAPIVSVSMKKKGTYQGRKLSPELLEVNEEHYTIPLPGDYAMENALKAIAVGLEMNLSPAQVSDGLGRFKRLPMRWEEREHNGIQFINDAYNANPLSMQTALKTFSDLKINGSKWVVLGGMRELGDAAESEHEKLGAFVHELGFDGVLCVGQLAASIKQKNNKDFIYAKSAVEAAAILKKQLNPQDAVLLKASRGEQLERVLNHFNELK